MGATSIVPVRVPLPCGFDVYEREMRDNLHGVWGGIIDCPRSRRVSCALSSLTGGGGSLDVAAWGRKVDLNCGVPREKVRIGW